MKLKKFQFEDIALAALLNGVIFSWEPGLGKTLAAFAWALIKGARRVLLVVPGGLHHHFRAEALLHFGRAITTISHSRHLRHFGIDRPLPTEGTRFFITTYQDLGLNNTSKGEPTLAQFIADLIGAGAGFDCVIIDEGVKLQSTETHIANGVRTLDPTYRMVLTGTPVKNRLESFFWLGWWAAGGSAVGNPLWPYEATHAARERFANDHLMQIRGEGRTERTARITNIHHLWNLIAPILIRRRKCDCGEEIPPKIVKPIRLAPGTQQSVVYANHLRFPPLLSSQGRVVAGFGQAAMQLNILRQAALCPHTPAISRAFTQATGPKKTDTDFNPKLALCLSLAARLLSRGQQLMVGSPFRAFSQSLHDRLCSAGVSSLLLDGQTKPTERGELAERFKSKEHSVLVVGIAAMSEGNSFPLCSHIVLPSLSWAYDENEQFVNRIWRLNSIGAVTVYLPYIAGTVDERLTFLFREKSDSAQLALDGRLIPDDIQDTDLGALLRHSVRAFKPNAPTIDESAIEHQWHSRLRARLTRAEGRYREITLARTRAAGPKLRILPPPTTARPSLTLKVRNELRALHRKYA